MFEAKVKTKTNNELLEITKNASKYDPGFLAAALSEIKNRELNANTSGVEQLIATDKQNRTERTNNWKVPNNLHSSINLASNLVYLSVLLGILNMYFIQTSFSIGGSTAEQIPGILSLVFVAAIGYAIRLGISWIRIPLLIFYVIGSLFGFGLLTFFMQYAPIAGIIYLLQSLIQLGVLILLFLKPANNWYKANKSER